MYQKRQREIVISRKKRHVKKYFILKINWCNGSSQGNCNKKTNNVQTNKSVDKNCYTVELNTDCRHYIREEF